MAMACAGASSSMAAATTGLLPRVRTSQSSRCLALPHLPPRPLAPSLRIDCKSFSGVFLLSILSNTLLTFLGDAASFDLISPTPLPNLLSNARRLSSFQVKASSTEETSTEDLLGDLKEKWDKLENKSTVLLYGGGAIVAVWLSSVVVSAINSVPLVSDVI
ncbi:hypothetical protein Cgig2_030418 [Carnegiea gigantea]|uniref:Cyanobacterial aminoacyl-tRNA synthetase CAAD domain-containing protein n=1 Tax=Carnegiea gigantea TaxID=171969 RepID=A0A9Q1KKZ6_9CARY|nr:hypothetical protein Cgig2_030418 [Carnegiea gigantea]